MFTTSSSINVSGQLEKLVNSLVLGTSVERLVGSSPTLRTIRDTFDTIVDTFTSGLIRSRKKGVLVVLGFRTYVSLKIRW